MILFQPKSAAARRGPAAVTPGPAAGTGAGAGQAEPGSPLLEIRGLSVEYGTGPDVVRAVDRVDLDIRRGSALGLAGESGSGKSTLAHAVTRLLRPPAAVTGGQVRYLPRDGTSGPVDVLALDRAALREFRWEEVAIVFQSAMNALNPVIDIRAQLVDTLRAHGRRMSRRELEQRATELLAVVGVTADRLRAYPHQLSGGMRQRVMIAMALALEPELLVMDEPTTALDVVTQRQILEQLLDLREEFGFALLFITHDLSLLLEIADEIAIMYAGRIVERGPAERLYTHPGHPYTAGLLRSFPPLTGHRRELSGIPGSPPDMRALPPGCRFAARCEQRMETCAHFDPPLVQPAGPGHGSHLVACWLHPAGALPEVAPAHPAGPASHRDSPASHPDSPADHGEGGAADDR
jgi:peptide/nickel transport system ATP-binding protein